MTPEVQLRPSSVITSEPVVFPGRNGKAITAFLDRAPGGDPSRFVVMAPKYGETKKNNLQLAYHLALNGINVLRFDYTNHVGESEGDMHAFTLPGAVGDIQASFDYLEHRHGVAQAGLVASSLAARMGIRATSLDARVSYLISLVGVVHVQRTLHTVYQEDVIKNHLAGKTWGVNDVLGFEIDFENFLAAAVSSRLHTLAGTCADLARIRVPVAMLAAQNDAWVDMADVERVIKWAPFGQLHAIQDAMHEVRENPQAAERTFRQLVRQCVSWAHGREFAEGELAVPDKKSYVAQNKIERERLRRADTNRQNEFDFWSRYLSKYEFMAEVDVYNYYIKLVGELLGVFRPGELVFDAGCGNGLFGVWAIRHLLEQTQPAPDPPVAYVGADLTHDGLLNALQKHARAAGGAPGPAGAPAMGLAYAQMDLDAFGRPGGAEDEPAVDFADNTFDKICCSLLLSYLKQPDRLVEQLHRVLRPGGRLVVSSMKPFCDLSEIYRRYAARAPTEKEIDSARGLLAAAGKIKVREEQGIYTFFPAEELAAMMAAAGFTRIEAHTSFGNQANVVCGIK